MSIELYLAYLLACFVIVIVPGPTVTLIVANSLAHGTRAGLLNVAGTQLGLAAMIAVLGLSLASLIATLASWFDWVRLAGAAYLAGLGFKLLRATGGFDAAGHTRVPRGGFLLQGFLVIVTNPKALLVFGAFIPQFVDPHRDPVWQIAVLGVTFMAVATLCDGGYAVLTGRARALIAGTHARLLSQASGLVLIGAATWLALMRAP
ncbi:MAG TPA: LysE family translocator [Xanthobacteraceae bacterium]|nr:LysE family translocator [Xanthobacteraceae bacterium]